MIGPSFVGFFYRLIITSVMSLFQKCNPGWFRFNFLLLPVLSITPGRCYQLKCTQCVTKLCIKIRWNIHRNYFWGLPQTAAYKPPVIGPSNCKQKIHLVISPPPDISPPLVFLVSLILSTLTEHCEDELWASVLLRSGYIRVVTVLILLELEWIWFIMTFQRLIKNWYIKNVFPSTLLWLISKHFFLFRL